MEVQTYGPLGIGVLDGEDLLSNLASDVQLFIDFAGQAGVVCFAWVALTAWELPSSCQVRALEPSRHEEVAVTFDDGGEDHDWRGHLLVRRD